MLVTKQNCLTETRNLLTELLQPWATKNGLSLSAMPDDRSAGVIRRAMLIPFANGYTVRSSTSSLNLSERQVGTLNVAAYVLVLAASQAGPVGSEWACSIASEALDGVRTGPGTAWPDLPSCQLFVKSTDFTSFKDGIWQYRVVVDMALPYSGENLSAKQSGSVALLPPPPVLAPTSCPIAPPIAPPVYVYLAFSSLILSSGIATAQGENALYGELASNAFDKNLNTKWLDNAPVTWLQYQFAGNVSKTATQYILTSANDDPYRDPKNWQLLGSNDGLTFVTLDTRVAQTFVSRFQSLTFNFVNTVAYKMYRLDILQNNAAPITQLAEFNILGYDVIASPI